MSGIERTKALSENSQFETEAGLQCLSAFRLPPNFRGRNAIIVQLWWIVQETLFRWSPQAFYGWRRMLLRMFGARIGAKVLVRPTVRVTYPWKLKIGDYAWIGDHAELYNLAEISIGANAVISQTAYLCTGTHDISAPAFDIIAEPITVGERAWVAAGAFIYPGLNLAEGSVIAARSVLRRSTAPYMVYAGSPATCIKNRIRNDGAIQS